MMGKENYGISSDLAGSVNFFEVQDLGTAGSFKFPLQEDMYSFQDQSKRIKAVT